MLIRICTAKIHRATVTEADLDYVGSITLDAALLEASGIRPFQIVQITNIANGVLWSTYVIAGEKGSGVVCLNGPPAHHFTPGDKIIILAEAMIKEKKFGTINPIIVFVDEHNKVTEIKKHSLI